MLDACLLLFVLDHELFKAFSQGLSDIDFTIDFDYPLELFLP